MKIDQLFILTDIYITVLLSHYTPFNLTNRKISNILVAIDGSEYSF